MTESSTGDWLRDLAAVVDKKDALLQEMQGRINNRVVVGWMHPRTREIISTSRKMLAEQSSSHKKNPEDIDPRDKAILEHSIAVFAELNPDEQKWDY